MSIRGAICRYVLLLVAVAAPHVSADTGHEWSVGASVGVSKKSDFDQTAPFFAANARVRLSELLVLEPEIGYWTKEHTWSGYLHRESDVAVAMRLLLQNEGERVRISTGLGLGFHTIQSERGYPDPPPVSFEYNASKLGIGVQGGLDVRIGRGLWLFGIGRGELLKGQAQTLVQGFAGFRFQRERPR